MPSNPETATMDSLIGRTIKSIAVNEDQSIMAFVTDGGVIAFRTEGDCCSEAWFADIVGVDALIGATVVSTEDIEIGVLVDDGRSRQAEDIAYGIKLATDKGIADIAYRCSHNGCYYGGWAVYTDKIKDTTGYEIITDDWQANELCARLIPAPPFIASR